MLRVLLALLLAGLLACPEALASFPGADGELAVQPRTGPGIELVRPDGVGAHLICTDTTLCGLPVDPRFAPDGHGIVFGQPRGGAVGIVAPDGTCLWCELGAPLDATGTDPAFATDGSLTVVGGGKLTVVGLAGGRPHPATRLAGVSAAASSPLGELAVVRHGWIVVGRLGGGTQRLVRGGAPSWSPDGLALAFARHGWVWRIRLGARPRAHRLVRGSGPAWSPDGRRIAFLKPGGQVATIAAGGGAARPVGAVRGRSVDWQPVPRTRDPCAAGRGRVIASSPEGVVREPSAGNSRLVVTGCLELTGVTRALINSPNDTGCYAETDITGAATSGREAALSSYSCDHEDLGECGFGVSTVDLTHGAPRDVFSEPDTTTCASTIASLQVNASGFTAWTTTGVSPATGDLSAIACPSDQLCVAGDDAGHVLSSTDPTGSASTWLSATIAAAPIKGLSCPTTSFCLAATIGGVLTSTAPAAGASSWTSAPVAPGYTVFAPSCPTADFCAALAVPGSLSMPIELLTSSDPTAGAGSWRAAVAPTQYVDGLSCPSTTLCVVADPLGEVAASTDPADPSPTWTTTQLPFSRLSAIDCPTASRCVTAGLSIARVVAETSDDPTGGAGTWIESPVEAQEAPSGLSCLASGQCVAAVAGGLAGAYVSADPADGAAWTALGAASSGNAVSCSSIALCAVSSGQATVAVSAAPFAGPYTTVPIDGPPCFQAGSDCTTETLSVHDDAGTRVIDTATAGDPSAIGAVTLSGNATTLTWEDANVPHALALH